MQRNSKEPVSVQMKKKVADDKVEKVEKKELEGDFNRVINTGSTLLNLAISGGRIRGGGVPGGILVEAFGPSGSGKTVLLTEMAGDVQRNGGDISFKDPEARLNTEFAKIFDLELEDEDYSTPDTVNELFKDIKGWEPKPKKRGAINGIFADSLAALSTEIEMEKEEGDKMGMKRAKDFSEQFRKICRVLKKKNYLMVCSNQLRVNVDAGPYGQKYNTPGGMATAFYASLRLRFSSPEKIKVKLKIKGKEVTRVIGIEVVVEVYKSSVWKPYHTAPICIIFDYGIDDIRANLQYVKEYSKNTVYSVNDRLLDNSIEKSIKIVEAEGLQDELKEQVIDLWEEIESKFEQERAPKKR